jgi:hypothetical protein
MYLYGAYILQDCGTQTQAKNVLADTKCYEERSVRIKRYRVIGKNRASDNTSLIL